MKNPEIDTRVFRRYAKEAGFTLKLGGASYPARIIDYSLTSVGMIIENSPPLKSGDIADLDIPALSIRQQGRVIWASRHAQTVRAGVDRIGSLTGTLSLYRLSDILIGLQRTLKTGILEIRQDRSVRKIYISQGNILFATSNLDEHRTGDILLKEGKITQEQYEQADERKRRTNECYEYILVGNGWLKPADLVATIQIQANRIIEGIFALQQADFEFREEPLPAVAAGTIRISAADLIYRELKKTADGELETRYLPDTIVDFSPSPLNLFQEITLDSSDRMLLSYVDGKTTVRDLIKLSAVDQKQAMRSIYALVEARILCTRDECEPAQERAYEEIGTPLDDAFGGLIDKIDETDLRFRQLNHYEILGIGPDASADEIRKAYYRAAKEYHPDRHFSLPEDVKGKLLTIFNLITRAYLTLKDYAKRVEYDASRRIKGPDTAEAPESSSASVAEETQQEKRFTQPADDDAREKAKADMARNNFEEGKNKFRQAAFEEAAHLFATAIYFDSSQAEYHYSYGLCLAKTRKPKEALQSLNKALAISPNMPDILAETGHIYLSLNCPVRAKGLFDKALRFNPAQKRAKEGVEIIKEQQAKE